MMPEMKSNARCLNLMEKTLLLIFLVIGLSAAEFQANTPSDVQKLGMSLPIVLSAPAATGPTYYVSTQGDDQSGNGSIGQPWATIGRAVEGAEDGATIFVRPGTYSGQVALERGFSEGISIQAEEMYQARLRHDATVIACYYCRGITLSGFDIAHSGEGAGRYVIQIQDLSDDRSGGRQVTLRNNVIHDSFNDDLAKINNGAAEITVEGNMFYNMGGPGLESMIDVNSATEVFIQDNVFFNDFASSSRSVDNDTGSFIVIKDSNGDQDANLGSSAITVRRNVFLNWEGDPHNTFLVIGEDDVDYFQAQNVLVENNLMLGNSQNPMRAAFHVRGSRDITFRNNTVSGDLPSRSYAMRLSRANSNPANEDVFFYNNIWSDPTSTMGESQESADTLFAQADPADTTTVELLNNLYWNGNEPIPMDENQLVNYTDDAQRIVADPLLPDLSDASTPYWIVNQSRFADGSTTIREAFELLVLAYGKPAPSDIIVGAADPNLAPVDDILAVARSDGAPDMGAFENDDKPTNIFLLTNLQGAERETGIDKTTYSRAWLKAFIRPSQLIEALLGLVTGILTVVTIAIWASRLRQRQKFEGN